MKTREITVGLILGVITNIVAAALLEFGHADSARFVLVSATVVMTAVAGYMVLRLRVLNTIGFKGWEGSISAGTSTRDCIDVSQRSTDFLGIAATKWTGEGEYFRKMLVRHATNGGTCRFLLLNPFGSACADFEVIKGSPAGSMRKVIIDNAQELLRLKNAKLPIDVRFYEAAPHFRVVIVDHSKLFLGLYAHFNDDGRGGPQLIFDGKPRPWSFYYAFAGYFDRLWAASEPAATVLANQKRRRKGDSAL